MWKDIKNLIEDNYKPVNYTDIVDIYKTGIIKRMQDNIIINGSAYDFYNELCSRLENIAYKQLGCIQKKYPLLLPKNVIRTTKYSTKFPQHCIFCTDVGNNFEEFHNTKISDSLTVEDYQNKYMSQGEYVLSPSACYHVYEDYKGFEFEQNVSFSFIQNVCRNEGEIDSIGNPCRLKSYNVREFVFIGSDDYVRNMLKKTEALISSMIKDLGLAFCVAKASDSFIMPTAEIMKKMQLISDVKHEFRVGITEDKTVAVGSVNYHGDSFMFPFSIYVKGNEKNVSGCVGIGIERLLLAYFMQKGV